MLEKRDIGILISIVSHCERVMEKVHDISEDKFVSNKDLVEIAAFNIFQIGELAKKLSDEFIKTNNLIPWRLVKGMRDRIAHGYGTIDIPTLYHTSYKSVPELHRYCLKLIEDNN